MEYDSLNLPLCKKSEIIVKFNKTYVKQELVNNLDISYGFISDFLTTDAVIAISNTLPYGRNTQMIRIFSNLKTTDEKSISRLGDTISIPDFWSAFILTIPESSVEQIVELCTNLESLHPVVSYAHQNSIVYTANCPNTEPNESLSSGSYVQQSSLHPNPFYQNSHINVLPAWGCTVGKPSVKVGVFDDLILRHHEDFEFDPNSGPHGFSAVKGGWDYEKNTCIHCTNPAPGYTSLHGTQVGGIIGAVRNNEIGIAGVAGGNWNGSEGSEGVSLYSIRVIGDDQTIENGFLFADLKYYADAIIDYADMPVIPDPCCGDENPHKCIRVDIMNHSLQYYFPTQFSNTDLVEDAVYFAYRNQVIFCAARGNGNIERIACPACYNDWAINVSATNANGNGRLGTSNFGNDIDIAAPGSSANINTTKEPNTYGSFTATSAATPHVSGVAGLLLSLENIPGNLPTNGSGYSLGPEDVESIIYLTAMDIDPTGPDLETGPGLLDAGNAVDFLLDCDFYHFSNSNLPPLSINEVEVNSDIDVQFIAAAEWL